MRVKVTVEDFVGSASGTSAETSVVTGENVIVEGSAPKDVEPPGIEGVAEEGQTLTTSKGDWEEGTPPTSYAYQWESCESIEENSCMPIVGQDSESYTPTAEVVGSTLRVTVTATNSFGSASAASTNTAVVLVHQEGTAVVAWGDNYPSGQLGAGYKDNYEISPIHVTSLSEIRSVAAAGDVSYALLGNGTVRSWGDNARGSLGDGSFESSLAPMPVVEKTETGEVHEITGVTEIAAAYGSYTHGLALVNDSEHEGEVVTWGASEYGERGNGEYEYNHVFRNIVEGGPIEPRDEAVFVPDLKHVVAIAAGGNSDFALQDEGGKTTLLAWGGDFKGKLGIGKEAPTLCQGEGNEQPCSTTPEKVLVPAGVEVVAVASSRSNAYALLSNGRVLSWGENSRGEMGNGTREESSVPEYICAVGAKIPCSEHDEYLEGITQISGGDTFALALRENGEVVGWGDNHVGELGGTTLEECKQQVVVIACQTVPKVVEGLHEITAVSGGAGFSLALNARGEVYSFGDAEQGELGNGTAAGPEKCANTNGKKETVETPCSREPKVIEGLSDVGGISAGGSEGGEGHSLVYLRSGSGPPPEFIVTPEVDKLSVAVSSKLKGKNSEYHIRWRQVPPSTDENQKKAEEWTALEEEYRTNATRARTEKIEAEEAEPPEQERAEKDEKEEKEYKAKREEAESEAKKYEVLAKEEYPYEGAKATEECPGKPGYWCYEITEAAIVSPTTKEKERQHLSSEDSYFIQSFENEREGAQSLIITAKPLPEG